MDQPDTPFVRAFYHKLSGAVQYVVSDPATRECAIIDPVLDFDVTSHHFCTGSADSILDYLCTNALRTQWILDTHAHTDHVSASSYLSQVTKAPTGIGKDVLKMRSLWNDMFKVGVHRADGCQWDLLLDHGDTIKVGRFTLTAVAAPGHSSSSVSYLVGDAAFIHDTLMMPDSGTSRCDLPGGNPIALWHTIQSILRLPEGTRLFVGHDYRPNGRKARWETSIRAQAETNVDLVGRDLSSFVALRERKDKRLPLPQLMLATLQINLYGGLPPLSDTGHSTTVQYNDSFH
ncbi:MBL fold metallo-hydrolase [Rhizobium sp. ZK1]|uniref:MBL fold metallo-hydrolase n=1 Tax=Rhizobium sp. ZK1 TaxID=3389872 RepID=UPI0039F6BE8E